MQIVVSLPIAATAAAVLVTLGARSMWLAVEAAKLRRAADHQSAINTRQRADCDMLKANLLATESALESRERTLQAVRADNSALRDQKAAAIDQVAVLQRRIARRTTAHDMLADALGNLVGSAGALVRDGVVPADSELANDANMAAMLLSAIPQTNAQQVPQ